MWPVRRRLWMAIALVAAAVLGGAFLLVSGADERGPVRSEGETAASAGRPQNASSGRPSAGGGPGAAEPSGSEAASAVRLPRGVFVPPFRRREAVLWAVGDGADGGAAAKSLVRRITRQRVDRFLYLGDVYESGTAEEFVRNYATVYGRLARKTAPTPGNHDWPRHVEGYDRYWRRVRGKPVPAFYSFRVGGWQVLSLNSEAPHDAESPQLRWLRAQVRRSGTCRLAFWHRPRYSAGGHHGDQEDVQPFWDALRGRAALVVNGHEHNSQFWRVGEGQGFESGIYQLVAGAGGHGLYDLEPGDARPVFADDEHYAALRIRLIGRTARFAFIASNGRKLKSGASGCDP